MNVYSNLGFFEKQLRKSCGYSLENVSHDIGISKGFLSEAENGRRILKPEAFTRFLERYGIDFSLDESAANMAQSLLNDFVLAWIDRDFADEEKIKRMLEHNRPILQNSLGCLHLLLIDIFLAVHRYAQIPDVRIK